MKKSTHGGSRKNAGRRPRKEPVKLIGIRAPLKQIKKMKTKGLPPNTKSYVDAMDEFLKSKALQSSPPRSQT